MARVVLDDCFLSVGWAMARSALNVLMVAAALPVVALLFVWSGALRFLSLVYERWE